MTGRMEIPLKWNGADATRTVMIDHVAKYLNPKSRQ